MKRLSLKFHILSLLVLAASLSGCYKLQKDYKYEKHVLDPHINMTAANYLYSRSDNVASTGTDTIFRWMKKGIEYAGIDTAEFSKPARTYIFLHNNAIKTVSSGKVTAGFFFDYPIIAKDSVGH